MQVVNLLILLSHCNVKLIKFVFYSYLVYFALCVCCGRIKDFHSNIIRGESFHKTCSVKINVSIRIVQFPLQVFVFLDTKT
jgi:hypothetical protein